MALARTRAIVIGSFPLGEADRIVSFFTRQTGKVRGVAKSARRLRSRFGSALELFTLGELIFFDAGRSDLVQVDHFDIVQPFARLRGDLDALGHAAWIVECVGRLTAERDANAAVYGLLARALASLDAGAPSEQVALAFGVRCIAALGHRLRTDACVGCGRRLHEETSLVVDLDGGGVTCAECAREASAPVPIAPAAVATLRRLSACSWAEATAMSLGETSESLRAVLDAHVAHLAGQPPRVPRFLREVRRFSAESGVYPR